jgi:hypothetical protein
MSGGLCHQTMRKKGPSYLVGYELAAKASHPVKETQCICAEASSVLELTKFITQKTKKHFDKDFAWNIGGASLRTSAAGNEFLIVIVKNPFSCSLV